MTPVQVPLSEALASLPSRIWPTITALQHQGVEVTCWREGGRWTLRGYLEGRTNQTLPMQMLTVRSVEDLWRLMKPVIEEHDQHLRKLQQRR